MENYEYSTNKLKSMQRLNLIKTMLPPVVLQEFDHCIYIK